MGAGGGQHPGCAPWGRSPEPHPNSPGPFQGAYPNQYPGGCAVAAESSGHRFESGLVTDWPPNPGQASHAASLSLSFPICVKIRENGSDHQGCCDGRMKNKRRVLSTAPGTPLALSRRLPCQEGPQGGQADVRGPASQTIVNPSVAPKLIPATRGERWLCCAPALGGKSANLSFNVGKLIWKFIKLHCPLLPVSGLRPRG